MSGENGSSDAYRFGLELHKRDPRELLATVAVQPDWVPALEWARFQAWRRTNSPEVELGEPQGHIEPIFDPERGRPYVEALRAVVEGEQGTGAAAEIPLAYFYELARNASSSLVSAGKLEVGEVFEYRVCAYADHQRGARPAGNEAGEPGAAWDVEVTPLAQKVMLEEQRLDDYLRAAVPEGTITADQPVVLIPAGVLNECMELMEGAGAAETGGILLGHLRRDSKRHDLFIQVSAQIPAREAQQELSRLTFTAETWASVEAALALRGRDELFVGWWHTHPSDHWCRDCPPEKKEQCPMAGRGDYFSAHDARLHRTVFPRAYSIALVLGGSCSADARPKCRLFGWEQGMIASRGFYVLDDPKRPAATPTCHQQKRA